MRDLPRLTLVLMIICAISGGLLAFVNSVTSDKIKEAKRLAEEDAVESVLPEATEFVDKTAELKSLMSRNGFDTISSVYMGYAGGRPVGMVFRIASKGYSSSNIEAMVGINKDGVVEAVRVISQQETPGLGSKVASPEFLRRFSGRKAGERIRLTKDGGDIAGITGATISSRAIAKGIDQAVHMFIPAFHGGEVKR